jgi:hypothetical protein
MIESMLFRKNDGTFVEINRIDYKNDTLYYSKMMELKKNSLVQKLNAMESFLQNKKGNIKK